MEQKWQTSQDLPSHLLGPLSELKSHSFDTLLQNLFGDLKVAGASFPVEKAEQRAGGTVAGRVLQRGGTADAKTWHVEGMDAASCQEAGAVQVTGPWKALDLAPTTSAWGLASEKKLQCASPT